MTVSRREWVAIISVFILAGILRLGYPTVNSFASDEARVSLLALETIREGRLATNGISSSTGARNLPASVYAFVIPYFFSTDPMIATQWVGLWSTLAVIGLWWLARRVWGALPSFLSALFLACAPFAVFFSRNIWTQNFLIPLTVFWMLCVYYATITQGNKRLFFIGGAVFLGGIGFQIHAGAITLVPLTAWFIVRDGWWRKWYVILVSGALASLFLVPFLHEAICCHPELISEYSQTLGQGERRLSLEALQYTAQIGINYGWQYLALGDNDTVARVIPIAVLAGVVLILGGMGVVFQRLRTAQTTKIFEIVFLTLIVPMLFFSFQSAPVRLHYLLPTLPALALCVGCIAFIPLKVGRMVSIGALGILAVIWSGQILFSLSVLDTQLVPNGMGMSLEVVRETAHNLPQDKPIMVLTQSDDVTTRGEPATWAVLLWDTPHRVIAGWTTLILPNTPTTLFTDVNGMPAWEEVQSAGLASDEQSLQIFAQAPPSYWVTYQQQPLMGYTSLETPISFANGLELIAWRYRVISGRLRISTVYRVIAEAPPATIQQFTHLRTSDTLEGAPPRTADIPLGAHNWRVGDTVIALADFLEFETGVAYWLDIGQYDLTTGMRYARLDGGDSVRLGVFMVE